MATTIYTAPLACATAVKGGAADAIGVAFGNAAVLTAAACLYGALFQAELATAGAYIYLAFADPADATKWSMRLAQDEVRFLPVSNLNKVWVWTDDAGSHPYLHTTTFNGE